MNLKRTQIAVIILIPATVFTLISCQLAPKEYAATDKLRLVWNDDPSSTMTIIWDQLKGDQSTVYYGKEDYGRKYWKYPNKQSPTRKLLNYYQMNTYYAELRNLEPDQTYYFVIQDSSGVGDRYYFRTAPDQPKAFTFIAGGDTKSFDKPLLASRASNTMVARLRPLFVVFNGDFTSGNGTNPDRWHRWLTDWDSLTTTKDGRKIPLVPVHGNHENGNKSILNKLFNASFQGEDSTNIYYSLSFGGTFFHIIALNSEIEEGGEQREWLEADLKIHKDFTFKIAGYHKPLRPHTKRKSENDYQYEQWAGLFYQYGLDLSIDGDSHMHKITYQLKPSDDAGSEQGFIRDDENGTMFIGEGSWGAHPRANDDDKSWTLQSGSFNQIKWIHVQPATDNQLALMEIFTVITSVYDDEDNQTIYVDEVENLTEDNIFEIPGNINLYKDNDYGRSVKYPFYLNQPN
ncbi:fibronectin type III domain-containing protein [Candidatus Neomarinimicrobiota bacterium]